MPPNFEHYTKIKIRTPQLNHVFAYIFVEHDIMAHNLWWLSQWKLLNCIIQWSSFIKYTYIVLQCIRSLSNVFCPINEPLILSLWHENSQNTGNEEHEAIKLSIESRHLHWVGLLNNIEPRFVFPAHLPLNRVIVTLVDSPKLSCNILVILLSL